MTTEKIWEEFLTIIRDEIGSRVVETWFKSITFVQWDASQKNVYLRAPNSFVQDWVSQHYTKIMQVHLGRLLTVQSPNILFLGKDGAVPASEVHTPVAVQNGQQEKGKGVVPACVHTISSRVNYSYSFNTFVVGPSNSLAYSAAHAVTEAPGKLYNPLFIYGPSGLGKTHLMHSIAQGVKKDNDKAVVLYQTTDRFVNEFINAIRFNKMYKFNAKYKQLDLLLLDDIQFISRKEQTQEAFFHIFNSLHESQKQLVISSDTIPQDIKGLAERLRSRLAWGLVADIQVPSIETKIAILKQKAAANTHFLDDEVAQFIAASTVSNIRELEGSLVRVLAFASLTRQKVTLELAQKVLLRTTQTPKPRGRDLNRVISTIAKYYSYSLDDLRSKRRNKEIAFARQVAMFLMKKITNRSLRDIGEFLGGRSHATVMHAIDRIERHAQDHRGFADQLQKMVTENTHS